MSTHHPQPLPENPSLEQLRKQAREWLRRFRAGAPEAQELLRRFGSRPRGEPTLATVQNALARFHRFSSWPAMVAHVRLINARKWNYSAAGTDEDPADQFLRLACLNWTADDPGRRRRAAEILGAHPEMTAANLGAAAAAGHTDTVRRLLSDHEARSATGPFGWSPLMYLAFARLPVTESAVLTTAELLLAHGADPNDGRFFLGLPTPFTVLTGVFGDASAERPAHRHQTPLAELLLRAGADPNDGQTLYNRMFRPDNTHLTTLFEFGLGRDTHGPWQRALGPALDTPTQLIANQLHWAICHGQLERVALLLDHGADADRPLSATWSTTSSAHHPVDLAQLSSRPDVVALLSERGFTATDLDPVDRLVAAVLAADRTVLSAASAADLVSARKSRPGLPVWAAGNGNHAALRLAFEFGWDVNAFGRSDLPIEQEWHTALHEAAGSGNLVMVSLLLASGADPDLTDRRFHATPLGWAREFGHDGAADLLAPLTR